MAMGNMYNSFPSLTSTLAYTVSHSSVVPSTSTVTTVTLTTKTEPIRPPSTNVKDSYYELYPTDSNNDAETCSSALSNASPRSQDEQALLGSFSGDRCVDIEEQEKRKLERKRARNRLAATKCRQRKIQKIHDLEKEVIS
ncbi:unnamed protein product [Enterobius vermicularis]|uniref:BZIP domain-containing protein n=1 Tax=Enterobius vermicularis TaxID=51028 RepID=A0A0N4VFK3_ENTVE|nr:unnamed protein product [Enterobius vermicularis]